jgi:hypothetical protein
LVYYSLLSNELAATKKCDLNDPLLADH